MIDDLLRWVPRRRYAVWHDRGLFHFLTGPAERRRYLELLDAAVVPGGAVVIGVFAEDGSRRCAGLRTARYSPDDLARAITRDPATETIALAFEMHRTPLRRCSRSAGSLGTPPTSRFARRSYSRAGAAAE